jgi:adenylosuccinate lyase
MTRVWSEEAKLETWLAVELAVVDAWAQVGRVRVERSVRARARRVRAPSRSPSWSAPRTTTSPRSSTPSPMRLGEEGRWFHYGLTSSDVLDTRSR